MRLSAKLSTDVSWWGPGNLGNSQTQQLVPSNPSSTISWLLIMSKPSSLSSLAVQSSIPEAQVTSGSSCFWSKHPLEIGQEFLLCQSYLFRLLSNTGSCPYPYAQPVIFHVHSKVVSLSLRDTHRLRFLYWKVTAWSNHGSTGNRGPTGTSVIS